MTTIKQNIENRIIQLRELKKSKFITSSAQDRICKELDILDSGARKVFIELFLIYLNDFLTVSKFAEYQGITEERAKRIINVGYRLHKGKRMILDLPF